MNRNLPLLLLLSAGIAAWSPRQSNDIEAIYAHHEIMQKHHIYIVPQMRRPSDLKKYYSLGPDTLFDKSRESDGHIIISPEERKEIDKQIGDMSSFRWTEAELRKYGLTNFTLESDTTNMLYATADHLIFELSKPIFIRNKSICFVYIYYRCGHICAKLWITALKKEGNTWKRWWDLDYYGG